MSPRGRTQVWSYQAICAAIQVWHAAHGRLPRRTEYDTDPTLPSATTVWRMYGSLAEAHFDAFQGLLPHLTGKRAALIPRSRGGSDPCVKHPLATCRMPTPAQGARLVYVLCACGRMRVVTTSRWQREGARVPRKAAPLTLEPEALPP